MLKQFIFCVLVIFSGISNCFSQESSDDNGLPNIQNNATEVILNKAVETTLMQLIKEYELLLNVIASTGFSEEERKEVIANSYTAGSGQQLFLDKNVIIESDIDPSEMQGKVKDYSIKKYLGDFTLFYSKSENPSVSFEEVYVVGKVDGGLIKVNFLSMFSGQHIVKKRTYPRQKRTALVRLFPDPINKWKPLIVEIDFNKGEHDYQKPTKTIALSQVEIKWEAATEENVYYEIYLKDKLLGSTSKPSFALPFELRNSLDNIQIIKKYGSSGLKENIPITDKATTNKKEKRKKTRKGLISAGVAIGLLTVLIVTITQRV